MHLSIYASAAGRRVRRVISVDVYKRQEPPYDAVVMAENVTEMLDDRVCIKSEPAKWENLRRVGENFAEGEVIVHAGHKIIPMDICALIEAGVFELEVYRKPKVAIFPTGDEIVEPEDAIAPDGTLRDGEIIDANSRMFRAMALEQGADPHRFPIPVSYTHLDVYKRQQTEISALS